MSNPKKQSFLGGAAILAAAVAIVKLIGAAYKLPLNNILGDVGMSYWDTAYKIYNFLLTFSTAGLPWPSPNSPARRIPRDGRMRSGRFSAPPSGSSLPWGWWARC